MMITMIWKELERSQWVADSILSPAQQSPARYNPCLLPKIGQLWACHCQKYHPALPLEKPTGSQLVQQNSLTGFSNDFAQTKFWFWFDTQVEHCNHSVCIKELSYPGRKPGRIWATRWIYIHEEWTCELAQAKHSQLCQPDFCIMIVAMYSLQQLFQVESGLILDVVQKGEKGLAYSFNCWSSSSPSSSTSP